jgi:hypothetical protein
MNKYRLTYDSGGRITVWEKPLEELLVPNGEEPLLIWMLRESEDRGLGVFCLEKIREPASERDQVVAWFDRGGEAMATSHGTVRSVAEYDATGEVAVDDDAK